MPFALSDQVQASVDVVTGNLLLSTTALSLPGVNSTIPIGASYNSLGWQTGATTTSAANNWAYSLAGAGSLSLVGSNIVYTGADGVTWQFVPVSGSATAYTSPAGFKQDLTKTGTTGYTLTDRTSRQVVTFDADGKATAVADRNGNSTSIGYASGQPTSVVSTAGPTAARTAALAYSGTTLTVTQTANASTSRSVKYVKDSSSNLTSFVDAQGKTTTFGYSGRDLTKITSNTGAVTNINYDGTTHKVARVDQLNTTAGSPGTSTTRLSYASATQTLVAGPNTDSTLAITAVPRTTYTINSTQKVVNKAVDAAGRERTATYTGNADVLSSTTGVAGATGAGTTTGAYGANGGNSRTSTTGPNGAKSQTTYGSTAATAYLPASTTDDAGNRSLTTFNGAGNALASSDASGATATLTYNTDGTVATASAPGNGSNKTVYGYTAATKQLASITPVTGTSLQTKAFTYDGYGRLASQTDGRGNTTAKVRSSRGPKTGL
ncbi:YD repeat-containing protein [Frigoribacterium sp. PhB160]|nr:YD repeat-containing protein [Frigoribacterium sp. PhB160]